MADPVSILGTASGVVSLGIQVWAGLNTYLEAVKDRRRDLDSAYRELQSLRAALDVIQAAIPRLQTRYPTPTSTVTKCLGSCQTELQALQEVLVGLQDSATPPSDLKGKIKEGKKKLSYPFHRPSVERVQTRLARANAAFQTALQVLNLYDV